MTPKRVFGLMLAFCFAAVSYWGLKFSEDRGKPLTPVISETVKPDYYLRQASIWVSNQAGQTQYRLVADEINHFPDDGRTELSQVDAKYYNEQPSPWRITSDAAQIPEDRTWIEFTISVVARTKNPAMTSPTQLATEQLRIALIEKIAHSSQTVSFTSDTNNVTANSMVANLKTDILSLKGQVRGVYVIP